MYNEENIKYLLNTSKYQLLTSAEAKIIGINLYVSQLLNKNKISLEIKREITSRVNSALEDIMSISENLIDEMSYKKEIGFHQLRFAEQLAINKSLLDEVEKLKKTLAGI